MKHLIHFFLGLSLLGQFLFAQGPSVALTKAFHQSLAAETAGDHTAAINALKAVYREESYETNLRLGWLHYKAGLFTESTSYYQNCIRLLPMSIEAKLGYVAPASALGNWAEVEKQYLAVLVIDPQHSSTNYTLGLIYYGRADYKRAMPYFQKVVNLYPFDTYSLLMLGWTHYFLGKTTEAKVLWQKVLLLDADQASALEGLGLVE